jgi:hypothetical protein
VFNQNPNLPNVLTSGPPGLEEVKLTAKVAKNLATMQAAKEAFIQCEADRTIAETLKSRLYVSEGQKVESGTWVYYKQHGKIWKGPVKIHSVDGKRLYAVRGGKLQCINRDDVILSRAEEQMMKEGSSLTRLPVEQVDHQVEEPNKEQEIRQENKEVGNESGEVSPPNEAPAAVDSGCPLSSSSIDYSRSTSLSSMGSSCSTSPVVIGPESSPVTTLTEAAAGEVARDDLESNSSESTAQNEELVDTTNIESNLTEKPTSKGNLVQCKECANVLDLKSVVAHNRKTHSIIGKGRNLSIPACEEAIKLYEDRKQEKSKQKEIPLVFKSQDMIAVKDAENSRLYEVINRAGKANAKGGKNKNDWFVRNILTGQERKLHTNGLQVSVVGKITDKTDESVTFQNAAGNRITKPRKEFYRYLDQEREQPEDEDMSNETTEHPQDGSSMQENTDVEESRDLQDANCQNISQVDNQNKDASNGIDQERNDDNLDENIRTTAQAEHYRNEKVMPTIEEEASDSEEAVITDENDTDEVYVATLPRYRHSEPDSIKAKMKELEDFKTYDVYDVVEKPRDKAILGTQWVITEKDPVKNEKVKRKARMCIMGNQENNIEAIPTESPTVAKSSIRLLLAEAARHEDWFIRVSDVTRAFLQTSEIEREVFVRPPKEAGLPGNKVWLLRKPAYGLVDASRGFYINQATKLVGFGMEVCKMDPAFFFYHSDGSTDKSEVRKLSGMVATHVDDSLTAGDAMYRNDVEGPMTEEFDYGAHDNLPFRYVGLNMSRTEDAILLDQDHYIQNLAIPDISCLNSLRANDPLPDQSAFRSAVAKLQMISITSRPDLCYDTKTLSRLYGRATKKDFQKMIKLFLKVKSDTTKMIYRNLNNMDDWIIVVYSDASLKKMPDTVSSCGARVVLLVNKQTSSAAVLMWKSKQLKRVVHSSMAAEAMSLEEALSEIYQLRYVLRQMHGKQADNIPAIAIIDCQDLYDSVHNLRPVEDKRLMGTIVEIKQAIVLDNTIQELRLVEKEYQVADGLTKPGANCKELLSILQTGSHKVPGGIEVKKTENVHTKTWVKPAENANNDDQFTVGSSVISTDKDLCDDQRKPTNVQV